MGCDIHVHFEIKVNNSWHHYSSPHIGRNYDLFGWLAGVRMPEAQVIETRSLPSDISVVTLIDWNRGRGDWHTPSWLSAQEITLMIQEFPYLDGNSDTFYYPRVGYLFDGGLEGWSTHPEDFPNAIEDLRMVFWFDN